MVFDKRVSYEGFVKSASPMVGKEQEIFSRKLLRCTAQEFSVKLRTLRGPEKTRRVAEARHAFTLVALENLDLPLSTIAGALHRDSSTIRSSYLQAQALRERPVLKRDFCKKLHALTVAALRMQADQLAIRLQHAEAKEERNLSSGTLQNNTPLPYESRR